MTDLKRSLKLFDGLAMVVGIMVGSGIFRTPGLVAAQLGRPWLTFVAWVLGGALAFLGALCFAELATRHPRAGGKYVYVREAFGPRAGFVVGWVESVGMYTAAIAAIGVAAAEFLVRLTGWDRASLPWLGAGLVALFTAVNLIGVASGRWVQNLVTAAKVLALGGVVVIAFARGTGAGWHGALADAPRGVGVWPALALASRSVIWTYYGYPDAAKIAEEVVDPGRTLPRVFLGGIAIVTALYLLLNAAFLHVLPLAQIATSNLVAADVATAIVGARAGRDALGRHAAGGSGRGGARRDRHLREAARPRHRGGPGDRRPHRGGTVPVARARAAGPVQHARLSGGTRPVHRCVPRPVRLDGGGAVAVGVGGARRAGAGVRAELGGAKRTRGARSRVPTLKRGLGTTLC